jgi:hypothetical protein
MPLNTAKIDDFSGGLNLVDDPVDLDLTEFVGSTTSAANTTKNLEIVGDGKQLRSRRGNLDIETSGVSLPADTTLYKAFTSMDTFRASALNGDQIIMSNEDGKVLTAQINIQPSPVTQIIVGSGGPNKEWVFKQSQSSGGTQKVYMLNGVDTPQAFSVGGAIAAWPGTPPNGTHLASWKTRMIIVGVAAQPQRLYYSDLNNPESFPANNFIDIKSVDDEADDIIAVQVIGENLLVLKRNSVWLVFDSTTFENRRITNVGVLNRSCACGLGDRVYWASSTGIHSTDGETTKEESININPVFSKISLYARTHSKLISTYENTIVFIPYGSSTPVNAVWVMYERLTRSDRQHPWVYHGGSARSMAFLYSAVRVYSDLRGNGILLPKLVGVYKDAGNNQVICQLLEGSSQDVDILLNGSSVDAQYVSPWLALQGSENLERLRRVNLEMQGAVTVAVHKDKSNTASFSQAVATQSVNFVRVRPDTRGRFHQIRISYTSLVPDDMLLNAVELKYRGGKEH